MSCDISWEWALQANFVTRTFPSLPVMLLRCVGAACGVCSSASGAHGHQRGLTNLASGLGLVPLLTWDCRALLTVETVSWLMDSAQINMKRIWNYTSRLFLLLFNLKVGGTL